MSTDEKYYMSKDEKYYFLDILNKQLAAFRSFCGIHHFTIILEAPCKYKKYSTRVFYISTFPIYYTFLIYLPLNICHTWKHL